MKTFRVAITGDYLNVAGDLSYSGEMGFGLLDKPYIDRHFIREQAPSAGDPTYWDRLYHLETPSSAITGVDAVVVLRPWVRASTFEAGAETLTVIARAGVGYDKIDIAACTRHDVAVFNAPVALHRSTATSALMFMLALAKRLPEQESLTRSGRWDLQPVTVGMELDGRTLGIIGLGASGQELVKLLAPFGMRIIAYSPHADPAVASALGVTLTSLDTLMRDSDFVSLHASLTPDKQRMIGAAQLALMKPGAYFINVARGELVDQAALVQALSERRIAGAGLDVYEVEPLPITDPLIGLDNVILTPHWSPATSDIFEATGRSLFAGVVEAAQGRIPDHVINREVLERPGFQKKLARFAENALS